MITADLTAEANRPGYESRPLSVTLRWIPADPYAVALDMARTSTEVVTWVLSRNVLAAREACRGDVLVSRLANNRMRLVLSSPDGSIVLRLPTDEVAAFLAETAEACPYGTEKVDVDGIIAKILGAEA